jgi:hypothetical protein
MKDLWSGRAVLPALRGHGRAPDTGYGGPAMA